MTWDASTSFTEALVRYCLSVNILTKRSVSWEYLWPIAVGLEGGRLLLFDDKTDHVWSEGFLLGCICSYISTGHSDGGIIR